MEAPVNPWVGFLRHYGPTAKSDNMYDESIQSALARADVTPVRIETGDVDWLVKNFRSDSPVSVVLTGTAGDGKTYHCREVWQALGGGEKAWRAADKVRELDLGNGRTLRIIKDLSELNPDEQTREIPRMAAAIAGADAGSVYLVAANDGQLHDAWHAAALDAEGNVAQVRDAIEEMLVEDERAHDRLGLWMFNLSREDTVTLYDKLTKAVLEHDGWAACESCPHREGDGARPRCPILENRERLLNADHPFWTRLRRLLELADANGLHLPIRHILLLLTNILLGHPDARDRLMDCRDARRLAEEGAAEHASPYANALGENLPAAERRRYAAFDVLGAFGVGNETNNEFDDLVVYGPDADSLEEAFRRLIASDVYYGAGAAYTALRASYVDGARETEEEVERFLDALRRQRQRLFFTLPDEAARDYGLWDLTVYRNAGVYLDLCARLAEGRSTHDHLRALLRGLNRVFTGLMVNDDDGLLLAEAGVGTQARVSRLYETRIASREAFQGVSLQTSEDRAGTPQLVVELVPGRVERFDLQLTHYDYLRRVAEGAMPTAFSHQCYEDLLDVKTRLLNSYRDAAAERSGARGYTLLEVEADGRVRRRDIEVRDA